MSFLRWFAAPRTWRLAAAAGALLVLGGCSGSSQIEPFKATRFFAFGDETSLINADGSKYTVNALKVDDTLDCAAAPLWVQTVATGFGLVFPQCNPNNLADPQARTLAAVGAKAADFTAQVDAFVAANTPADKDLTTVLVGMYDVLELYAQYPARSLADLSRELRSRGGVVGAQVNRLAQLGPAVLVATIPDLGSTPFGLAEKAANTDTDRAALLSELTSSFNAGIRLGINNDGRLIGIVLGDDEVQRYVRFPLSYGFLSTPPAATQGAACLATAPLPTCNAKLLAAGATPFNYVWADSLRLSAGAHIHLGNAALSRAVNNPF